MSVSHLSISQLEEYLGETPEHHGADSNGVAGWVHRAFEVDVKKLQLVLGICYIFHIKLSAG